MKAVLQICGVARFPVAGRRLCLASACRQRRGAGPGLRADHRRCRNQMAERFVRRLRGRVRLRHAQLRRQGCGQDNLVSGQFWYWGRGGRRQKINGPLRFRGVCSLFVLIDKVLMEADVLLIVLLFRSIRAGAMKHSHEFRDPIHTFISVRTDERTVIDSRPFQRLRHIHQLALSYLVYPGATHKRFEHSLGVMDLASQIFDVVTDLQHVFHDISTSYINMDPTHSI
jgi:hypothetical protein